MIRTPGDTVKHLRSELDQPRTYLLDLLTMDRRVDRPENDTCSASMIKYGWLPVVGLITLPTAVVTLSAVLALTARRSRTRWHSRDVLV